MLVTILLAGGVIIGMLAIVIDVGRVYEERRRVQNGADAAVLSIAQACANKTAACGSNTSAVQQSRTMADVNAGRDQATGVDSVCGSGVLGACRSLSPHAWDCQPQGPYTNYARVRTSTLTASGSRLLPPVFAQALDPRAAGSRLWACAQAAWGPPKSAGVLFPLALSLCDYTPDSTVVIKDFQDNFTPGQGRTCTVQTADGGTYSAPDLINGFVYVTLGNTQDCTTPKTASIGDLLRRETNIVQLCGSRYEDALQTLIDTPSVIPVFDKVTRDGVGLLDMRVASFISFTLKGYSLKGGRIYGSPSGGWPPECRSSRQCLYGSFGREVTGGDIDPGGPNLGIVSVRLIP
jgi:hypothetical protein